MSINERNRMIARYIAGVDEVMGALEGITAEELDFRAGSGKWTCREVIHHLADSEAQSYARLRDLPITPDIDPAIVKRWTETAPIASVRKKRSRK